MPTLDPTTPADADSPRQGASKIRSLTLQLLALLSQGGGAAVTFAAAPFNVDTSGNVTIPTTLSVPTPTATAHAVSKTYADQLGPWTGVAAGINTYTVTLLDPNGVAPNALAQLIGAPITVQFTSGNTGPATLNANGFGAKPIQAGGSALSTGALLSGLYTVLIYDGTQFEVISASSGVTVLDRQANNPLVDVVSTNAETSLYSKVVPANTLSPLGQLRLTILGDILNNTGVSQTIDFKFKFGGTTIFDTGAQLGASSPNRQGFTYILYIQNLNATNRQFNTAPGLIVSSGTSSIDTTAPQTLQATVQLGASSGSLEVRCYGAVLEVL